MEVLDCTKILASRIQNFEPEIVNKIVGYLLLNRTHEEIIEYAYGPDELIHGLIMETKTFLAGSSKPNPLASLHLLPDQPKPYRNFSPTISRTFSSPSSFRVPAPCWEPSRPQELNFDLPSPSLYNDYVGGLHNQGELLCLEDRFQSLNLPEAPHGGGLGSMTGTISPPGVPEFPPRLCHYYFTKGFCKHGINCRYLHDRQTISDDFSSMLGQNMHDFVNDDHVFAPASLEKLEVEISALLRGRNGVPVSIAALPMMYQDMYGKTLQAEGYLTESQRHGKVGISLTKLLARLNNIQLIDRPHGQHSVVLAEDAPNHVVDYTNERVDSSSHQIYLTFPAESSFTEEDVANYFKQYGPVHDVRIPRQEKRMFGFVSFHYPETVKTILAKGGHPHFVCGARVLVKPYKEKTRHNDKKYMERLELPTYYPKYFDMDRDSNTFPRVCESPRLLEKQLIQDQKQQVLELERRLLCETWPRPPRLIPYYGHSINDLNLPGDRFSSLPSLKSFPQDDEKHTHTSNSSSDHESNHFELPDSPFSSPR